MKIKRGKKTIEIKAVVPGLIEAKALPENMEDLKELNLPKWERDLRARARNYRRQLNDDAA